MTPIDVQPLKAAAVQFPTGSELRQMLVLLPGSVSLDFLLLQIPGWRVLARIEDAAAGGR